MPLSISGQKWSEIDSDEQRKPIPNIALTETRFSGKTWISHRRHKNVCTYGIREQIMEVILFGQGELGGAIKLTYVYGN